MDSEIAAVESPQSEPPSLADASTDDLRNALGVTEPALQEAEPEPGEAPPEEAYPSEGQVDTPPVEEEEAERLAKRRIRPKSELDQQVIDLYRSDAFQGTFADASRIIYQQTQPDKPPPPQEAEAPQPDPYVTRKSELEAEIVQLEEKVKQAADDLETTEALNLQREVMRKEFELQNLKSQKERSDAAAYEAAYREAQEKAESSRDRVFQRFPVLQDENSVERKQFDEYIRVSAQNPDYYAVFESPMWPEIMASEFAIQMQSYTAGQAEQPAPVTAPARQAPSMGTQAKVLTTGTATQPVNSPATAEGVINDLPNISSEDLYKLLGTGGGGSQPLR